MTWHKKVDACHEASVTLVANSGHNVQLTVTTVGHDMPRSVFLTVNQAGDLSHALQEAIRHAQDAKP